jgi:hypothetical protein
MAQLNFVNRGFCLWRDQRFQRLVHATEDVELDLDQKDHRDIALPCSNL